MHAANNKRHGYINHAVRASVFLELAQMVMKLSLEKGITFPAPVGANGIASVETCTDILPTHGNQIVFIRSKQAIGHAGKPMVGFQQMLDLRQINQLFNGPSFHILSSRFAVLYADKSLSPSVIFYIHAQGMTFSTIFLLKIDLSN